MRNSALHRVRELVPDIRAAIEKLLGRTLQDNETISVTAYRPHSAPSGPERAELARRLEEHLNKMAEKVKDVPEAELDAAIDEAVGYVRHHPE